MFFTREVCFCYFSEACFASFMKSTLNGKTPAHNSPRATFIISPSMNTREKCDSNFAKVSHCIIEDNILKLAHCKCVLKRNLKVTRSTLRWQVQICAKMTRFSTSNVTEAAREENGTHFATFSLYNIAGQLSFEPLMSQLSGRASELEIWRLQVRLLVWSSKASSSQGKQRDRSSDYRPPSKIRLTCDWKKNAFQSS